MSQEDEQRRDVLSAARDLAQAVGANRRADAAVEELVAATAKVPVSGMEMWERALRDELWSLGQSWPSSAEDLSPGVPWLDFAHGSGFYRERALRTCSREVPNGFLFAIVLRRLNDWVPHVRLAARECVPRIARETRTDHILPAIWTTLSHLHTWRRLRAEGLGTLMGLLGDADLVEALERRILSSAAGPVARVFSQVSRKPFLDPVMFRIARAAVQPAVRAKAYQTLLRGRASWLEGWKWAWVDKQWGKGKVVPVLGERELARPCSILEILAAATGDQSVAVRRVAGDFLVAHVTEHGAEAAMLAKVLSEDPRPSVAERGRYALKKSERQT